MNEDERNEMIRRWVNGGGKHPPRLFAGGFVPFHVTDEADHYHVRAQHAASSKAKDWTKIETYWPHLAGNSGAASPRQGV